jgi:two-component system cell cycle sensor histidine kinase/response regulator CckA
LDYGAMTKRGSGRLFGVAASTSPAGRAEDLAKADAEARQKFGLWRWFAGIGHASEEAQRRAESPEADARVRDAVDQLPVSLFEFDADGTYISAAGRYVRVFGVSPAHVLGRSVFDFPRFVPGKNAMVRRALAGETVAFTGFWPLGRYAIRLQPRLDAHGRVQSVIGLGYELTQLAAHDEEVVQLLDALRQSETRFRAMCERVPLGIYVCNPKLELGYVNPALCALTGRSSDELVGCPWPAALFPHEPELHEGVRVAVGMETRVADRPLLLARKDGATLWTSLRVAEMHDGAELVGYVGAITDVSQERTARLAVEHGRRDLRRVIETSPEGIAVIRDGRFVFVNRALTEALGHARPEDLIGQPASALVHPEDRARAPELSGEMHAALTQDGAHELRCRKADGEYALLEIRSSELSEFEGAAAVLITTRDVTERARLQANLRVTERLLAVGTLAAGVAHEINNPLAVVMSNLEWVSEQLAGRDAPPELQGLEGPIGEAREAAARVRTIVGDLKLLSRAEDERAASVQLTTVLDSAARMAWNEVRHRARFVREYGELPPVHGSAARLGQVFLNLIINAAQAIPEGNADAHEIRLCARALSHGRVLVEVKDSGGGIPASVIARIFDPFFTTKPPGVGTGLGLTICHRIVTSLGGQIEVESAPGRGTTFRVTLAVAESEPAMSVHAPSAPPPPCEVRGRVLVIDDDSAVGHSIALLLRDDHEVEVLTSSRHALRRLRGGERFDAILCDVMMPEMSGADLHAELAHTEPALASAIVFMSGGAFTLPAREFLDRIPNPRLEKPFDAEQLRRMINRQIARSGRA